MSGSTLKRWEIDFCLQSENAYSSDSTKVEGYLTPPSEGRPHCTSPGTHSGTGPRYPPHQELLVGKFRVTLLKIRNICRRC
jgi:hypothetical protein